MINIVNLILGILILFIPGFLLSFLLFEGSHGLDFWERIATSVGLSALVDMLVVTILAQPQLKALSFSPVVGGIAVFSAGCAILIKIREGSQEEFLNFIENLRR